MATAARDRTRHPAMWRGSRAIASSASHALPVSLPGSVSGSVAHSLRALRFLVALSFLRVSLRSRGAVVVGGPADGVAGAKGGACWLARPPLLSSHSAQRAGGAGSGAPQRGVLVCAHQASWSEPEEDALAAAEAVSRGASLGTVGRGGVNSGTGATATRLASGVSAIGGRRAEGGVLRRSGAAWRCPRPPCVPVCAPVPRSTGVSQPGGLPATAPRPAPAPLRGGSALPAT